MRHVFYLHGFASSARSTKAAFFAERLRPHGLELQCPDFNEPDFETLTVSRMLEQVDRRWRRCRQGRSRSSGRAWAGSWRITPRSARPPPGGGRGRRCGPSTAWCCWRRRSSSAASPFGGMDEAELGRGARRIGTRSFTTPRTARGRSASPSTKTRSATTVRVRRRHAGARVPGTARHRRRPGHGAAVRRGAARDVDADGRRRPPAWGEPRV